MLYRGVMENTPVGRLTLHSDNHYIIRIDFDKPDTREIDIYFTKWFGTTEITPGLRPVLAQAMIQLAEYFDGRRKSFDLEVLLYGTDFQRRCWAQLCNIPYGETISYKTLAQRVGSPKGFRAVGQANHSNPLPIVIPCHRVLASGGGLGGFGGGLEAKRRLLDLEMAHV